MTFEQFQSTREHVSDLRARLPEFVWVEGDAGKASGFLYLGALHIEDVTDNWPEKAKADGKHYLLIGNLEWISNDLEKLERELYDFAVGEGYTL